MLTTRNGDTNRGVATTAHRRRRAVHPFGMAVMLGVAGAFPAQARTFDCADVPCLIQSIHDANANGRTTNTIRLSPGTYTLTDGDNVTDGRNGLPSVSSTLIIAVAGEGVATLERLSTAPEFRLLHVQAQGDLTLQGITVAHGGMGSLDGGGLYNRGKVTLRDSGFSQNIGLDGGAILNRGTLTVSGSVFRSNVSLSGGGIDTSLGAVRIADSRFESNGANFDGAGMIVHSGTVDLLRTTVFHNSAEGAGGVSVEAPGILTVSNSAFIDNISFGGSSGGLVNRGTTTVNNTTFAGNYVRCMNTCRLPGAVYNFGRLSLTNSTLGNNANAALGNNTLVLLSNGTTYLQNTLFANGESLPGQDCSGPITSLGNNLFGPSTGCGPQSRDLVGDPALGDFADDGTPGNGHFPLLATSPAIDAADTAACGQKDQIGTRRPRRCDIGAIEFTKPSAGQLP